MRNECSMNAQGKQEASSISSQQRCYAELKEAILRLEIQPGERIGALEAAARLGVSRTPVREALGQLEKEGLVAHDPAGGYVVRPMTVKEIDELYRVRAYLETQATLEAMPRLAAADLTDLAAVLDAAEASAQGDAAEFLDQTRRFHEAIILAADNDVLRRVLAPIRDRVRMIGAMLIRAYAERAVEICAENRSILAALADRNENAAVAAVKAHVGNGRKHMAAAIARERNFVLAPETAVQAVAWRPKP